MIDSHFQSSPPLTLVMDFFIYQQLSLSFSACPVQPALRFKCCVKQICASALSATSTSRFAPAAEQLANPVRSALRVVCVKCWAQDRAGAAAALDTSPGDIPTAPPRTSAPHPCLVMAGLQLEDFYFISIYSFSSIVYPIPEFSRLCCVLLGLWMFINEEKIWL